MNFSFVDLERRLPQRLAQWAPQMVAAHICYGVDMLLIAAIMDRESQGGEALKPRGPKGVGDGGHGRGLMQIDDRSHGMFLQARFDDKLTDVWTDPAFNILYGTRLIARNTRMLGGNVLAAIAAYNAGPGRAGDVMRSLGPITDKQAVIAALDEVTSKGPSGRPDYVSDVMKRWENFQRADLNA
jgi:soluble lytic murein transglycosylase-like protein